MDLSCFAIPFSLAIYWRRRPEFHRRLMLVASCALTNAAFGRFPFLPHPFSPAGVDALIFLGILRDLIVDRRIHKVPRAAFSLFILFQIFCVQTYLHTAAWSVSHRRRAGGLKASKKIRFSSVRQLRNTQLRGIQS